MFFFINYFDSRRVWSAREHTRVIGQYTVITRIGRRFWRCRPARPVVGDRGAARCERSAAIYRPVRSGERDRPRRTRCHSYTLSVQCSPRPLDAASPFESRFVVIIFIPSTRSFCSCEPQIFSFPSAIYTTERFLFSLGNPVPLVFVSDRQIPSGTRLSYAI